MFDQKLNDFPPSMVGELPRQMLANEFLTMNGQGFGNEKATLETTQAGFTVLQFMKVPEFYLKTIKRKHALRNK